MAAIVSGDAVTFDGPCLFLSCTDDGPHVHPCCPDCGAIRYGNIRCPTCRRIHDIVIYDYTWVMGLLPRRACFCGGVWILAYNPVDSMAVLTACANGRAAARRRDYVVPGPPRYVW